MHTNLISRQIHATFPVPGGGGGGGIGQKNVYQKSSKYDFMLIWRPKKNMLLPIPK